MGNEDNQEVISAATQRRYMLKDMVRIINPKQIALYLKNGLTLYDVYASENAEGHPIVVALFSKAESKFAYDLWQKFELR